MHLAVPRTESPFLSWGLSPTQLTPKCHGYSYKNLGVQQRVGKWNSPLERCAVMAFPVPRLSPEGSPGATLGTPSHPGGTRIKFAGSGANFCALKKVARRLLFACYLVGKGLSRHYCFHEGSSDCPVICNNLVVPRVSSCIPWLFHPKCCLSFICQ